MRVLLTCDTKVVLALISEVLAVYHKLVCGLARPVFLSTCRQLSRGHRPATDENNGTGVARRPRSASDGDGGRPRGAGKGEVQAGELGRVPAEAIRRRLRRPGDGGGSDIPLPARAIASVIPRAFEFARHLTSNCLVLLPAWKGVNGRRMPGVSCFGTGARSRGSTRNAQPNCGGLQNTLGNSASSDSDRVLSLRVYPERVLGKLERARLYARHALVWRCFEYKG